MTEARSAETAFAVERAWRLNPQVALRDESFGALAYHYGNRRLVFLKSRTLVTLVSSLAEYPSATAALAACVPEGSRAAYARALARLAASEVIDAR
ncbi:MAG TPA: mycofactocin biosynthesis chaperone MftB [Acidimicrobiales bacterium]|nr:mycofactocin biosynthesis chaperone MftB [Acidimicrobiales bacterium]